MISRLFTKKKRRKKTKIKKKNSRCPRSLPRKRETESVDDALTPSRRSRIRPPTRGDLDEAQQVSRYPAKPTPRVGLWQRSIDEEQRRRWRRRERKRKKDGERERENKKKDGERERDQQPPETILGRCSLPRRGRGGGGGDEFPGKTPRVVNKPPLPRPRGPARVDVPRRVSACPGITRC